MPPDYLGRNHIRLRGCTVLESDTGDDIGDPKRDSHEGKLLADATGWNSGETGIEQN
jgi:hypothetical protein